MRFKKLDLNLLVALDVLLSEKNVSRAADKLCLSQSATSGALARLREYFNDELLVQIGRKMVLTPRAQALADKVRAVLIQVEGTIINAPNFDPATEKRNITIIASDYVLLAGLGATIRKIQALAPQISFTILPPSEGSPARSLERGDVELLAMPEIYISDDHPSDTYFEDDYSVLICKNNPKFGDEITKEEFYNTAHVGMQFSVHTPSFESWFMKNKKNQRNIAVSVGSFNAVPLMVIGTENIALMQTRIAKKFCEMMPLRMVSSPVEIPKLSEKLQWHKLSENDECLIWVRDQILQAVPN